VQGSCQVFKFNDISLLLKLSTVEGMGKLGIVTDIDKDGNGYYISFDVSNGVVKIRTWGYNPANDKQNFIFNDIQSNLFTVNADRCFHFSLLRYGNYIEVSVDGTVKLTLIDYMYSGNFMGLYSASSKISLQDSIVKILPDPEKNMPARKKFRKILTYNDISFPHKLLRRCQ
jgi:beta-fructofuranosidase